MRGAVWQRIRRGAPWAVGVAIALAALAWAVHRLEGSEPAPALPAVGAPAPLSHVAALGRIRPGRGVTRIAGPPRGAVVIGALEVEEGDRIEPGQVIAVLEGVDLHRAEVARFKAELANAERELDRDRGLYRRGALSDSDFEAAELRRDVARASLARAEAELELSHVRSPIRGQVLDIHAREGERVGPDGIAELGETHAMYAVAEVYETDIGRVRVGQRATARSPALSRPLHGTVERIGLQISKQDVLSTDPVADVDARVVEVDIRLDDPEPAARLTNLRVDVVIEP